ncbi:protein of unknown function [Pseudomonas mediterranea]
MGQARAGQGRCVRPQPAGGQGAQGRRQGQGAEAGAQTGRAALIAKPIANASLSAGVLLSSGSATPLLSWRPPLFREVKRGDAFVARELAPAGLRSSPDQPTVPPWQLASSILRRLRRRAGASSLATEAVLLKR